jgi:squalene-associated FAD-dependent desaturase
VSSLRVAVVGGGLAGLAAAVECADAGAEVTLYESRRRLGGATFSVRRNGYWLDNGQHVALRCCTAYRLFLRRLGVEHLLEIQPRLRIPVLAPGGRKAVLDRTALPAPLHLASTLLRYGHLSLAERLAAVRAARALQSLDPADLALDTRTFGEWLRAHGQSERAISALWNLIALPTLNLGAAEASLLAAVKVFRTGLLDDSDACDVGVPLVPLEQLHGNPAARALREHGARIELGTPVHGVSAEDGGFAIETTDAVEHADTVVVAVPHHAVASLVPSGLVDAGALERLGESPIVNVHLHFDRQVLDEPFAAALESPVQWVFDRTRSSGVTHGQLVSISLSNAERELPLTQEEIVRRVRPGLEELLPAARHAQVLDAAVTKEPKATFRAVPGTARLRSATRTALPGLFLAGAWTDTGWPATMEGAVRSGLAAAQAALAIPPRRSQARDPLVTGASR